MLFCDAVVADVVIAVVAMRLVLWLLMLFSNSGAGAVGADAVVLWLLNAMAYSHAC
jgi:hypothetical protein